MVRRAKSFWHPSSPFSFFFRPVSGYMCRHVSWSNSQGRTSMFKLSICECSPWDSRAPQGNQGRRAKSSWCHPIKMSRILSREFEWKRVNKEEDALIFFLWLGKGWWSHCGESHFFRVFSVFFADGILFQVSSTDWTYLSASSLSPTGLGEEKKTDFYFLLNKNFLLFFFLSFFVAYTWFGIPLNSIFEGKSAAAGNWYSLFLLGSKTAYHCIRESWFFFFKSRERGEEEACPPVYRIIV